MSPIDCTTCGPNLEGKCPHGADDAQVYVITPAERIARLEAKVKQLTDELDEAKAEVASCVEFLRAELDWEYFRAEMLYHDQPEPKSLSRRNALKLKTYLEESGHGLRFLERVRPFLESTP
jgi:hypothetical protein